MAVMYPSRSGYDAQLSKRSYAHGALMVFYRCCIGTLFRSSLCYAMVSYSNFVDALIIGCKKLLYILSKPLHFISLELMEQR
ncbi:unnamed protein product [Trifolium pratense]|uniref:Uncharacterized protein n=1 Tax=Trifolium pratense TaxID=57577 RepID=A0ACB0L7W9_TRIPR|nr:unnamed protein product [Trifolium pratense]